MCRTKIVATLGPACDSPESISKLIQAGVDIFRLNFSHGSHEIHRQYIRRIRTAASNLSAPVGILMDLQGPKIRTGPLSGGKPVSLLPGNDFVVTTRSVDGDARMVSTSWSQLPTQVSKGDRLLVSDGLIELLINSVNETDIHCTIITGGTLSQRQGINLPGVRLSVAALTEKDRNDLKFGLGQGIDFVALSFVRASDDIQEVKQIMESSGQNAPVIAKIERPEALENFPDILNAADGIMVARGDLGVEISPEKVPLVQKQIIAAANRVGKPVITATQMLDSMIRNPRPTRAETSDVANAIIDGTDAVMLSGETATGKHPIEAVKMMARIAPNAETVVQSDHPIPLQKGWLIAPVRTPSEAIADAACSLADNESVRAIVLLTQSGLTAQLISARRPKTRIYALTPNKNVYHQLALVWGVRPVHMSFAPRLEQLEKRIHAAAKKHGFAEAGELVLIVGGHPLPAREPTNFLKLLTIEKD